MPTFPATTTGFFGLAVHVADRLDRRRLPVRPGDDHELVREQPPADLELADHAQALPTRGRDHGRLMRHAGALDDGRRRREQVHPLRRRMHGDPRRRQLGPHVVVHRTRVAPDHLASARPQGHGGSDARAGEPHDEERPGWQRRTRDHASAFKRPGRSARPHRLRRAGCAAGPLCHRGGLRRRPAVPGAVCAAGPLSPGRSAPPANFGIEGGGIGRVGRLVSSFRRYATKTRHQPVRSSTWCRIRVAMRPKDDTARISVGLTTVWVVYPTPTSPPCGQPHRRPTQPQLGGAATRPKRRGRETRPSRPELRPPRPPPDAHALPGRPGRPRTRDPPSRAGGGPPRGRRARCRRPSRPT